jgi:hypothetical protein
METVTPKNLTHRGTVQAEAFLLPAQILSREEMRGRVLGLWRAGVQVFRLGDSLIVRLPEAGRIDSRRSPGLPFVRYGKLMSAFPLEKKNLANFRDSGECLIFLDEGKLETIRWQDLGMEDVGEWFDLTDFQVIETKPLGGEEPAALTVMEPVSEADLNIREKLEHIPSADSQLSEIIAKLKELRENQTSGSPNSLFQSGNNSAGAGGAAANFFASVFSSFKNLFASGGLSSGANAEYTKQSGHQDSAEPDEPDVFARLYNRLRHLAVKAVVEMRMASVFGRRQAKYIAEMMEKFERGDLSEALKYAIPLEDMQALQNLMQKPTSLFVPRPRSDLTISFGRNVNGSSINLGDEWFNHLREMYRKSFERLEAQGRIEEATFVLAELLKSNAEAVEFLAKHGRYRLAAELAEARDLPKETVVRQWYLAGEKMRAVRLAILHNCFEYAVTKLEQENSETGTELREFWAESLAVGGNFPAAVDVIWKLETKRARAKDWIEKTIEFGGAPAGRMLARKAMLFPEDFDEVKEKFREILKGSDFESVEKRNAFARAVFKQEVNDKLRTLLRPLVRKISNDAVNTSHSLALKEFRELVVMAKDNALRTDLPPFPQVLSPAATNQLFEISISAADRGASFVYDACVLPDGKIAAALGESGVKVFSRNSKQIAFFDQPAHKLVVSDFANKAIALAMRGEITRLARIDFLERRASYWCDTKLNVFAPNFDGATWFVGLADEFYAIDANARNFEALWRVSDVGGTVYAAVRSKTQVKFLTLDAKGFETWWYELPNLTLRSRNQRKWLETTDQSILYSANISEGGHSVVIMQQQGEESEHLRFYANIFDHEHLARKFEFPPETIRLNHPEISNQYSAVTGYTQSKAVVNLFFGGGNLIATFVLKAAQNVSTKFDENHLTIADDCGRILVFDYKNQALRYNLRV